MTHNPTVSSYSADCNRNQFQDADDDDLEMVDVAGICGSSTGGFRRGVQMGGRSATSAIAIEDENEEISFSSTAIDWTTPRRANSKRLLESKILCDPPKCLPSKKPRASQRHGQNRRFLLERERICHRKRNARPRLTAFRPHGNQVFETGVPEQYGTARMPIDLTVEKKIETLFPVRANNTKHMGTSAIRSALVFADVIDLEERMLSLKLKAPSVESPNEVKRVLEGLSCKSLRYRKGSTVELSDGGFLAIETVLEDAVGDIFLEGRYLIGSWELGTLMPERDNELIWVIDAKLDSQSNIQLKHSKTIHFSQVLEAKRSRQVIFTNDTYPHVSLETDKNKMAFQKDNHERGYLYCRWKKFRVTGSFGGKFEETISRLSEEEADGESAAICSSHLRDAWRGFKTNTGGSFIDKSAINEVVYLECDQPASTSTHIQKYTLGDAFCGVGGVSSGARQAGLHVSWGFDKWTNAIAGYRSNFEKRGTECLNLAVHDFLHQTSQPEHYDRRIVDVLHVSPPCQPFSPAHTVDSQANDEQNQAALFSCHHLVETLRPRIVTIEQTEGILNRHREWCYALLNIFLSQGFSIKWRVVGCHFYGVPQLRRRFFLFAAGPGEVLPSFPKHTHGPPGSGLRDFVTIGHKISNLSDDAPNHEQEQRRFAVPHRPLAGNEFAKTLTTSGGIGNWHPSGLRRYTGREMACLQTFPRNHSFGENNCFTHVKRMIGNAVPPVLARRMFEAVIKSLRETDGV